MIKVSSQEEQNYIAPEVKVIDVDLKSSVLVGSTENPEDDPLFPTR